MRILFSANPSWGHLLALRPLADAARALGHDVAFVAGREFAAVVSPHRLLAAGPDLDTMLDVTAKRLDGERERQPGPAVVETMAGTRIDLAYDDALTAAAAFAPELLVCGSQDYIGSMLAAALARPWVEFAATAPPPRGFVSALERRAAVEFERRGLQASSRVCLLDPMPAALRREDEPFAADRLGIQPVPLGADELVRVTRPPDGRCATALLSLGSLVEPGPLAAMARSLRSAGLTVLVTATPDAVGSDFPQEGCELVGFVPFSELLPRADVVVSAGGTGTLLTTLGSGLPMVIRPFIADQPWNATRLTNAGAGLAVDESEAVGAAATRVLNETSFAEAAAHVAAELSAMDPPRRVLARLLSRDLSPAAER